MYSILILDVSGSKKKYFQGLIDMANGIIPKQMNNKENEGVIILFVNYEKATINGKYKPLNINDIYDAKAGRLTSFYNSFKEAEKYINNKNKFMNKRILILTDRIDNSSRL